MTSGTAWLAKSVLSKNMDCGVSLPGGLNSYGDNYINDNGSGDVCGAPTTASTH